ncbi:MAG: pyridoxal phosphate-dependent aminotransferase [bacterium]
MIFSARTHLEGGENRLTTVLRARRAAGLPVLDLTASNPTRVGLAWPADALAAAWATADARIYRPDPLGLPEARAAVAAAEGVPADRVVLTASTSEAYALLFKVLCDPGDAVLALVPGYPLFEHLARFEGVALHTCPLAWDGAWHVDVAAVRAALTPRTRALLVVSPNNPTGQYLRPAELARLAGLGLPVIVDEVFRRFPHAGPAASALAQLDLPVIVLDGLSKRCGLPQVKAGWMVVGGPPAFADALLDRLAYVADAYLSIGTPVQLALPALLADAAGVGDAIHGRTRASLAHLYAATAGRPVEVRRVEGGWYAVLTLPATQDDEAWALGLLDAGVLVQPGFFYDFPRGTQIVVSLLTPAAVLVEGVERLTAFVAGG